MNKTEWSKREKVIARQAFEAAYFRECMAAREVVREMAAEIEDTADLWRLSDYLTENAWRWTRSTTTVILSLLSSSPG